MLESYQISLFKDAHSTEPVTVRLIDFLTSKKHRDRVEAVRLAETKDQKDALKKTLPAATISGIFEVRKSDQVKHYNGLICMDFDGKDNPDVSPEEMKKILAGFDSVAYAALSVGGAGVYAIIPTNNIDAAQHGRICNFLRTVFLETGILADPSCKDITRLRFISFDLSPHFNPHPVTFDAVRFLDDLKAKERAALKRRAAAPASDRTRYRVERYIEAIESGCNDVTHDYEDWLRIGFALASEFGADGENYYHQASQFNPHYDYQKTSLKYAELLKNGGGRIRIATFFYICQKNGIKL